MRILPAVLIVQSVIGAASAALKPIETDIRPVDNKAVAVYKTTPQGDLKINLYFPPNWKASDRRPAIVFFFGGSCATGSSLARLTGPRCASTGDPRLDDARIGRH